MTSVPSHGRPTMPPGFPRLLPHDSDAVSGTDTCIPHAVQCGLHVGRQDGTFGRQAGGERCHERLGQHEPVLVGMEAEDVGAGLWAALHRSDGDVAVLNGKRERALLVGTGHGRTGRGDTAVEDQRLGASADSQNAFGRAPLRLLGERSGAVPRPAETVRMTRVLHHSERIALNGRHPARAWKGPKHLRRSDHAV